MKITTIFLKSFYKIFHWFKSFLTNNSHDLILKTATNCRKFWGFEEYFEYFWSLTVQLNNFDPQLPYFYLLKKQARKCLRKHFSFHRDLLENVKVFHTFKRPYTWSLITWRKSLRDYFREFFQKHLHLQQHNLVIFREFHQCRLECHYYQFYDLRWKELRKIHKKQACQCKDLHSLQLLNHPCKMDIHQMTIADPTLDFSTWPYGHHQKAINPQQSSVSKLIHPITRELVDQTTTILSYSHKEAAGRFKDPQLYLNHHDNPKQAFFDTFDYKQDKSLRELKKTYNQRYFKEKKHLIQNCLSKNSVYVSVRNKISYLSCKIARSRGATKKILRLKRANLNFELKALKMQLLRDITK